VGGKQQHVVRHGDRRIQVLVYADFTQYVIADRLGTTLQLLPGYGANQRPTARIWRFCSSERRGPADSFAAQVIRKTLTADRRRRRSPRPSRGGADVGAHPPFSKGFGRGWRCPASRLTEPARVGSSGTGPPSGRADREG
jgi:hypothetical protein